MASDFNKKQKRGFSKKKFYFVIGSFLFLIASGLLIFADINIYKKKQKLITQLDAYKKQIQEIQDRNNALKTGVEKANNNDYIEKVAREELNLQKQGENVVAFIMPPQQPKQQPQTKNFFENWLSWLSGSLAWIKDKF